MTPPTLSREKVHSLVQHTLANSGDHEPLADDDSLVLSGRMSSLTIVDLVIALETEFGFDFSQQPFDQNAFDSVDSILQLLTREPDPENNSN